MNKKQRFIIFARNSNGVGYYYVNYNYAKMIPIAQSRAFKFTQKIHATKTIDELKLQYAGLTNWGVEEIMVEE